MEDQPASYDDTVSASAKRCFGLPYLYPYQRFVVAAIMDHCTNKYSQFGNAAAEQPIPADVQTQQIAPEPAFDLDSYPGRHIVILPTGAGKSLCFQLPAVIADRPSLLVYPLLGLMHDQERRLRDQNIACSVLQGGMSTSERSKAIRSLQDGSCNILITNPEALCSQHILDEVAKIRFFHFVIDEAHCIAEWGDTFRPSYLELGRIISELQPEVITAFTATASPSVLKRVAEVLFAGKDYTLISGNADRPNIYYEVRRSLSMKRLLSETVREAKKPLIIFIPSRSGTEICAMSLQAEFPENQVRYYHAGLEREEKAAIEQWFMQSDSAVLCATCAYGMGMDKANIRTIIHTEPPGSVEAYLQEAGRAGRDGQPAKAILLCGPLLLPVEAGKNAPESGYLNERRCQMTDYLRQNRECRRNFLLRLLGSTEVACSGCDVCAGEIDAGEIEKKALLWAINRQRRRLTTAQASAFLSGRMGQPCLAGFGLFADWKPVELEEALHNSISRGWLRVRNRWPWKQYLYLPGHKPAQPIQATEPYSSSSSSATALPD